MVLEIEFSNSLIVQQVKKKHKCELNKHIFLRFYFFVYSLVLVSIEKIYQTLETVFHHISKHIQYRQKHSAVSRIFNPLLSVWNCDETLSRV